MKVEIPQEIRAQVITSIQRYFQENMPEPVGDLAAGLLLSFFIEEFGGIIYNQAIANAQTRIQQRLGDLGDELYVPEFQYWPNVDRRRKSKS